MDEKCEHEETDYQKLSGLHYDTPDGEKSLSIRVTFCASCGELIYIEEW